MKGLLFLAGILVVSSCRMIPPAPPVPVQGTVDDLRVLSGEWTGRYWSQATGRHGTIRFSLPEHADTGFGEVEITFSPSLRLLRDASATDGLTPKPSTVIDIRLVRVEGSRVRGTMAPYWDPDCDCRVRTVFEGVIAGDRVTGTFNTQRASSDRRILTGKWQAIREGAKS
jgi:hypothetical protein